MERRRVLVLLSGLAVTIALTAGAQAPAPRHGEEVLVPDGPGPAVDLAIALDISDSMEPLLEAARLSLWDIVNSIAAADPPPRLRVALLTFGSSRNSEAQGWVRVEADLTTDLDLVAERLFELETDGGLEYVSRAVKAAVEGLRWTPAGDAIKMIVVAGNEPADQDPEVDLRSAGAVAADEGIPVTLIYCGNPEQEEAATWKELALHSEGRFAAIDQRSGAAAVSTPYDEELARLGAAINSTFIPLGESGRERQRNLVRQDENVAKLSPASAAGRAQTKASPGYSAGWDLISVLDSGRPLGEIDVQDLPDELQRMTAEGREAYIATQRSRRDALRQQIAELSAQRRQYVIEQVESGDLEVSKTFGRTVRDAIRAQAKDQGLELLAE